MLRRIAAALAAFLIGGSAALAQSSPGLRQGQVPTAAQWNSYFAAKQDYLGFTPITSGNVLGSSPIVSTVGGGSVTLSCPTCIGNPLAVPMTASSFIPTSSGTPAAGLYLPAAGTPAMAAGSAESMRWTTSGARIPVSSGYLNFGSTDGTSGYGFRDNAGTMQFKNSAGSWSPFTGGPSPSTQGGSVTFADASGTFFNGKGACNIRAYGADEDASAATNAAAIQAAIDDCGMIYIPGPAGTQTYDGNGLPTKCFVINATLTWSNTLQGGALGDGPSVSCISSNVVNGSVMRPQSVTAGLWRDFTVRHEASVQGSLVEGACGMDLGRGTSPSTLSSSGQTLLVQNVFAVYNHSGLCLGHTGLSVVRGGMAGYNLSHGVLWSCFGACTPQWSIEGGILIQGNVDNGIYIKCNTGNGTIAPNAIINVNTYFNGGWTIEVDGDDCGVDNFRVADSFLGEGGLGNIYLHSAGTTPYLISNVLLESPGFGCLNGTPYDNCDGNIADQGCISTSGAPAYGIYATGTAPLHIINILQFSNNCITYGARIGNGTTGPTFWSIVNSSFQNNKAGAGAHGIGLYAQNGLGFVSGSTATTNERFGLFFDSTLAGITTVGVRSYDNAASSAAGSPNVVSTAANESHTGGWCGSVTAPSACTW